MGGHAKEALKAGIVTGDGKLRQIEIVIRDSQSDSQRAAQVAGELVQSDNVDMLLASGTPDTCNPVSAQGEVLATPSLNSFAPWQALYFDSSGKLVDFKWVFGNMLGSEQTIASFTDAFETSGVQTNKKVGMLFQNDADAQGWMAANAAPKVFADKGYTLVVPSTTPFRPRTSPSRSPSSRTRVRDHLRHQRPAVVLQLPDPVLSSRASSPSS